MTIFSSFNSILYSLKTRSLVCEDRVKRKYTVYIMNTKTGKDYKYMYMIKKKNESTVGSICLWIKQYHFHSSLKPLKCRSIVTFLSGTILYSWNQVFKDL